MLISKHVHLTGMAYEVGRKRDVSSILDEGESDTTLGLLVAKGTQSFSKLDVPLIESIARCAVSTMTDAGVAAEEIDGVLLVTESYSELLDLPPEQIGLGFRNARNAFLDMLVSLRITKAAVFSSAYGGSSNFLQAVFLAKPLVESGKISRLLIICADKVPAGISRFMQDAIVVTGDGVASCIVMSEPPHSAPAFELEYVGISAYANIGAQDLSRMVLEMYRSTKSAAADCYDSTQRQPEEFGWLILNNYNKVTNQIFARLLGFDDYRTYLGNVGLLGHIPACDSLINLKDLISVNSLAPGTPLLFYINGPISCGVVTLISI
jgi:3-oxoacyl-[acyl-carrier-protein] synthase III